METKLKISFELEATGEGNGKYDIHISNLYLSAENIPEREFIIIMKSVTMQIVEEMNKQQFQKDNSN